MSNGPFAYVEAINSGRDIAIGSDYSQFLINKAFSYHADCLPYVDYINQYKIPDEAHFKFLRSVIRPRKRHAKWPKPQVSVEVKALMEYFQVSQTIAEQYMIVLSAERVQRIITALNIGK